MATFTLEHLINALNGTVSEDSDTRKQCEQLLTEVTEMITKICNSSGAITLLLNACTNSQISIAVRLGAAIRIKNEVNLKWSDDDESIKFDKDKIRSDLYESIKACSTDDCNNIRAVLLECFRMIICSDPPEKNAGLINVIISDICQRQDPVRMIIALTALRQVLINYEYRPNESPAMIQNINSIVDLISGPLISIASEVANSGINNNAAAAAMHYVIKIYWSFALLSNSTCEKLVEQAPSWNQLFLFVLASDYSQITLQGNGVDEREWDSLCTSIDGLKCLKWTLRIANRFVSRYTSKTHADSTNPAKCNLYNIFITSGTVNSACQSVITLLKLHYSSKIFLPSSILYSTITFLKRCLQLGAVYKTIIKPHNEELALIMYNTLKLSAADEQRLENDRQEFIECQMDECYNYLTPRQAVSEFISYSTKYRGSDFIPTYVMLLGRYLPSNDIAEKFGSMTLLGLLSDRLTSKKRVNEFNVFLALSTHIMPEFNSSSMWLQIKACWVYSIYVTVANKWALNQDQHLIQAYKLVFEKCLDSNFVVKSIAIGCIKEFFNVESEHLQSVINSTVAQLVPIIFEIMAELDIETVATTLNDMIDKYRDQVTPHSAEIAAHLVNTLKVLMTEKNDETSDFSLTALTLLQTLTSLCDSLVCKMEAMDVYKFDVEGMIVNHIAPLISYIFDNKCVDYYDENIVLLSLVIKLTKQPGMFYSYLDKILQSASGEVDNDDESDMSFLYVEQIIQSSLAVIKLLFQRDPHTFCSNTYYQQSLMAIVNRANADEDIPSACVLLSLALFATASTQTGDAFLSQSIDIFNKTKIMQTQDWNDASNRKICKVVLSSLYYSTSKYCGLIDRCEMGPAKLKSLLEYIASASFNVSERKLIILSLIQIFRSLENVQLSGSLSVLASSLALLSQTLVNAAMVNAVDKKNHTSESLSDYESGSEHSFLDYQDTHVPKNTNNDSYDSEYDDESEYESEESEELVVEEDEYRALGQYIDSSSWAQSCLSHTLGQAAFAQLVQTIKTKL